MSATRPSNIVLVHGGFVDGSGWEGVYRALKKRGHRVSIVQNPTVSLAGDVAATKLVLDAQDGPVVLVGHSYGGVVVTEAGNDPRVAALVYIAAFAPDAGESVSSLIKDPPPGAPVPPILPPRDGFLFLDPAKFHDVVRGGPRRGQGGVHGRFPDAVGRRCARRRGHPARLVQQAELVPGRDRRPDDPTRCAALHGPTRPRHRRGRGRQPRDLRLAARSRRRIDRAGGGGRKRVT